MKQRDGTLALETSIQHIEQALGTYTPRRRGTESEQKWAGVAAILRAGSNAGVEVMLIRRSENPKDPWSGHMAMPGGRKEPSDASVQMAAERETREEVDIDLASNGRFLGRLDDVAAVARGKAIGLIIAPFVYVLERDSEPHVNEEVQEAVWVPLADLEGEEYRSTLPYSLGESNLLLPCWRWHGRVVWGLTYGILDTLLRITR